MNRLVLKTMIYLGLIIILLGMILTTKDIIYRKLLASAGIVMGAIAYRNFSKYNNNQHE